MLDIGHLSHQRRVFVSQILGPMQTLNGTRAGGGKKAHKIRLPFCNYFNFSSDSGKDEEVIFVVLRIFGSSSF